MGLMDNMAQATVVKKIHIDDIRENKLNNYDMDEIEELSLLIKEKGQRSNAIVYYDSEMDDGKHYTLISGHRRYCAIKMLYDQQKHDGFLECRICEKPLTELDEKEMILIDNAQREKKLKDRKWEVLVGQELYKRDKAAGIVPPGTKARDYIGQKIGLSGRQVQNILSQLNKKKETKVKDYSLAAMERQIARICDCKIILTDKTITFKCNDVDDLNRLLDDLGIQNELDKLV